MKNLVGRSFCTVRYSGIDDAIDMINRIGKRGKLAKTDIKSAFRLLRVSPSDFDQLGFSFDNKFYFDKCLPFGASISCSLFENFQQHYTGLRSKRLAIKIFCTIWMIFSLAQKLIARNVNSHYKLFGIYVNYGGVPVAEDKTVEPTEILTFLGIELDTLATR
jgi:hypothetical protein